jgi:hypothetical protein
MADELMQEERPAGTEPSPPILPSRARKKKSLKIDKEAVVLWISKTNKEALDQYDLRREMRVRRERMLRGWLSPKSWPYANCSNVWIPTMLTAMLKTSGTLENAVKSMRPIMSSKAKKRHDQAKQERIDQILDYQFHVEQDGNKVIDAYVWNFVNDEAAYTFTHWIKDRQTFHDIRVDVSRYPGASVHRRCADHVPGRCLLDPVGQGGLYMDGPVPRKQRAKGCQGRVFRPG